MSICYSAKIGYPAATWIPTNILMCRIQTLSLNRMKPVCIVSPSASKYNLEIMWGSVNCLMKKLVGIEDVGVVRMVCGAIA